MNNNEGGASAGFCSCLETPRGHLTELTRRMTDSVCSWEPSGRRCSSVFRCFIPQPINYPSINSSRSKSNIFKVPIRIFTCSSTAENGHSLKNSEIFTFFSSFDVEILQQSQCENHCTNLKPHREKFSNPCVTFTHNYCRLCSYKAVYPFMLLPENCNSLVALTTN